LRHVLGHGLIAREVVGDGIGAILIGLKEEPERLALTLLVGFYDAPVYRLFAHHRARLRHCPIPASFGSTTTIRRSWRSFSSIFRPDPTPSDRPPRSPPDKSIPFCGLIA